MRTGLSHATMVGLLPLAVGTVTACRSASLTSARSFLAEGLNIRVSIDPDPPAVGSNRLLLEVLDDSRRPVEGAQVKLAFDMPAMGSMAEMKGVGEGHSLGHGRYELSYELPMDGDWDVDVDVIPSGRPPRRLRLRVSPPRRGFSLEGAGDAALSEEAVGAGKLLEVSPARQQLIGVTYGTVAQRPLSMALRAAGSIKVDERSLADVSLRFEAYAQHLAVAETGKAVRAGQTLLTVYSPELLAAEEELLNVERGGAGNTELVNAARRRLRSWDVSEAQVVELERRGKADGTVTVPAPISGVVLEKNVVEGSHLGAGTVLYRIGNLGRVWVETHFFQADAPFVAVGQEATVRLGTSMYSGRVTFLAPTLDEKTRTLSARIGLENPDLALKPGMFAGVEAVRQLGTKLAVPDRALLLSGEHRYAFVERGAGKLQPVEVQLGAQTGDWDEVRLGLSAGDRVVLNAAFLISSEAQLRSALPHWSEPRPEAPSSP